MLWVRCHGKKDVAPFYYYVLIIICFEYKNYLYIQPSYLKTCVVIEKA